MWKTSLKAPISSLVTTPSAPVGLGHLGAQHDDADGEGDAPGGVVLGRLAGAVAHLVDRVAGHAAENRADRSADGEAGGPAQNFAPDAHGLELAT
jgi:hypothetical protein